MQAASQKIPVIAAFVVACLMTVGVASSFAQSLGAVARREREKNRQHQKPATHVYTNDDMKREEILVPQDRARIEAEHKLPASVPENAAAPANFQKPAELPLGTVARYYRELNQAREQRQMARERVLPGNEVHAAPKLTAPELIPSFPAQRLVPRRTRRPDPFSRTHRRAPVPDAVYEAPVPAGPRRASQRGPAAGGVTVRPGDSLWKLATRYLGDGAKWREIASANPQLADPNVIRVGQRLQMPAQKLAARRGATEQRVSRGDSLWKLAQNHLGSGFAWGCIAEANPQISNVNRIYPGQILSLPASCGAGSSPSLARASN